MNDGVFQLYAAPFVVATEGTSRITARATDRAGNVESSLPAAVVLIDSSSPTVTIASPESRDYQHSDSMIVSFSAADGTSGSKRLGHTRWRPGAELAVVATIDNLTATVNIYAAQGKIDASKQRGLLDKLSAAKAALDRGNTSAASAQLRDFLVQCNAQSGRGPHRETITP